MYNVQTFFVLLSSLIHCSHPVKLFWSIGEGLFHEEFYAWLGLVKI